MKVKGSQAGWGFWLLWVAARSVGWGLCMAVMVAGMEPVGVYGLLGLVGGPVVLGAVTGAVLVWLLRQPVPEA